MKLYTEDGWLDVPALLRTGLPFLFVVGGRGTGKTYGALKEARRRSSEGHRFIYLRRTLTQIEIINKPEYCPFKALDANEGYLTAVKPVSKYSSAFYDAEATEDGKMAAGGPALGYTAALSVASHLRSQDMSDCDLILYDEFIKLPQEHPIKGEAAALWGLYETVNRNREQLGRPACQLLCLANANELGNPVFMDLKLIRRAERMRERKQEWWQDDKRGIGLAILQGSPISARKRTDALYRMLGDSEYTQMALDNAFSAEEKSQIKAMPLKDLIPIVAVGEICIYRSKTGGFYVSGHRSGSPPVFGSGPKELQRFRLKHSYLWIAYLQRRITFEEYSCEICFCNYMNQ